MTTHKQMMLTFDVPDSVGPMEVISAIAEEGDEDESGCVTIEGSLICWDMRTPDSGVKIDRRQRLAAAILLMAFDLPQEMTAASCSMLEAARICPGLTTGEIGDMGADCRQIALKRVRDIVDEMLCEISG